MIELPSARYDSDISIEKVIKTRRSQRTFADKNLSLKDVAQLLWAGQGTTSSADGRRAVPSAGALYPLEIYAVVGGVEGIADGIYGYLSKKHILQTIEEGDHREEIARASFQQNSIVEAPLVLIIGAVEERTSFKYGDRAIRYILIEAGCCAQNIQLQARALGMGTVVIGAFLDDLLHRELYMDRKEVPILILPIGFTR